MPVNLRQRAARETANGSSCHGRAQRTLQAACSYPISAPIKITREEFEEAMIASSLLKQKQDTELREAASLALRTIDDTLRHVEMRKGERAALEKVSEILRKVKQKSQSRKG